MSTVKKRLTPRVEILNHLKRIKRPLTWLTVVTDIPYGTLYSVLKLKSLELTQERLDKINKGLGTDFKL
jgi:hypothetical protein